MGVKKTYIKNGRVHHEYEELHQDQFQNSHSERNIMVQKIGICNFCGGHRVSYLYPHNGKFACLSCTHDSPISVCDFCGKAHNNLHTINCCASCDHMAKKLNNMELFQPSEPERVAIEDGSFVKDFVGDYRSPPPPSGSLCFDCNNLVAHKFHSLESRHSNLLVGYRNIKWKVSLMAIVCGVLVLVLLGLRW